MNKDHSIYSSVLYGLIESLHEAVDVDCVMYILENAVLNFGYTNFVILDLPITYGEIDDVICLDKLPEGWMELYTTQNYASFDPVVRMCRKTFRAFDWKEARYDPEGEPRTAELMEAAREFGMSRGFCVPVPGFAQRTACISMSGQYSDLPAHAKPLLQFIATYAAEKIRQMLGNDPRASRSPLTLREREVLQWAAAGKTANDVAEIMNITERTVTAHIVSAMDKLGAANKTQAVARAIQHQFIALDL